MCVYFFLSYKYLFMVSYFYIGFLIPALRHEVPKYNRLLFDDVVELDVKLGLHLGLDQVVEPAPVLVVHQTILEHAATLVVPQPHHIVNALKSHRGSQVILNFLF